MAKMTSRERVRAAIHHREPDRVPLDIGGGNSTTMVVESYERLKHLNGGVDGNRDFHAQNDRPYGSW
jgi:uroporphyrinogen decarboxylase